MAERILRAEKRVVRHSVIEIAQHWLLALSGFVLLFSGFGEMPMYKRYMITELPLMAWSGDFFVQLKIHYLAAMVFVSTAIFHVVYHGLMGDRGLLPKKGDVQASLKTMLSFIGIGQEPPAGKYLAEQRLAYAYMAIVIAVLIVTGLIKVARNLPGVYLSPSFLTVVTLTHVAATLLFLFGVLAHLAAFIFKINRPLLRAIFTGKADHDYIRHRHSLWYEELAAAETIKVTPEKSAPTSLEQPDNQLPETTLEDQK